MTSLCAPLPTGKQVCEIPACPAGRLSVPLWLNIYELSLLIKFYFKYW